jgi:hypothetical protein
VRASDRDRDQAVALLRARCVEGYISVETLEYRLGRALAARTALELRLLVADIARVRRRWRLPLSRSKSSAAVTLPAQGTRVLGRSAGCDVIVDEPTVSRRHVELRALDGAWLAIDLGSMNGTWLQGRRVGRTRVLPGDELVLGDCVVALERPALTAPQSS